MMIRSGALIAVVAALSFLMPRAVGAGTLPDITGTWYLSGNNAKRCHIQQSGSSVTLTNELGEKGSGTFENSTTLSTTWHEWHAGFGPTTRIVGHITGDLRTITWSNGTYWSRASGSVSLGSTSPARVAAAAPTPTPTPNPYRLVALKCPNGCKLEEGKIEIFRAWGAVRRDGTAAISCVGFTNQAAVAATRVEFEFKLVDSDGAALKTLHLDRRGTFSHGVEIHGWPSLSDWQHVSGHRDYTDNCTGTESRTPTAALLATHIVNVYVIRVDYADGSSWPLHEVPSPQPSAQ